MKSFIPKEKDMQKRWHVIDAEGQVLGRLATKVATLLTGKDKPVYTPFLDTGDHVVVINAEKVKLTGKKLSDKMYRYHTGFPGGLKETTAADLLAKNPGKLIQEAVTGMLPKTKLGRAMRKKLKVYAGAEHPHQAQRPEPLAI
ncbi:MAG: 50S ribosomal protein L13 [Acidobacteriota bacterium]|jgi:large subunit ribosomal protein L13|nr:50S ribosomal protein L13 [Acidobacteriota bacterium]